MFRSNKIIITGGHLTPALAIISKLQKEGWEILFIGRKHALEGDPSLSVEYKTIKDLGIPFVSLTTGRLQRSFTRYTLFSLLKVPVGFFQSLYWVLRFKPDIILSFGGYLALPVALASWFSQVPVVTHEQSVIPGLATKIIGLFARKICVSWEETLPFFPKKKVVLTGNPLREEIFKKRPSSIIHHLSSEDLPLIYITGGSLGAHSINQVIAEILPRLLTAHRVIHQCGDAQKYKDYEYLSSIIYHLSSNLKKRYFLTKYVEAEDIGWVFNSADLVVSRSGANIVTELAACGKPAILIPLPWAGSQEQAANARLLKTVGIATILPQDKLTAEAFLSSVDKAIKNLGLLAKNASQAKKLVNPHAADNLMAILSEVAR